MIIGDYYNLMAQIELIYIPGYPNDRIPLGTFNFIIDGEFYPGKGCDIELFYALDSFKNNLECGLKYITEDLGDTSLYKLDIYNILDNAAEGNPNNIIELSRGSMLAEDHGFICLLGFDGDEERLIFSNTGYKNFQEIRYPKGTVEAVIRSLPRSKELRVKVEGNQMITYIEKNDI
ncbi:Imm42 family immunity protein [Stenoxybacter acetivorans]|uniref:Imm42 family immunity protein n=1 Tax=Stenoxybacter acetivorans TaxID=422441 RepID=UPI000690A61A|nr:Imm42 family immunity protein [Stenoxybacter acetivorans]